MQRLDDLAQRLDEVTALIGLKCREDALIDARGHRLGGAEGGLALGGQPHGIHARIAPRALAVQQPLFHQATHDVSQLLLTIDRLQLGYAAMEEAFRRIAFNVMAANCDDHTKNTSFMLREGGTWELAPAYDVTYAYNPKGEWTYQHLMSVNGKFANIARDDLMAVADRFGVGTAPQVLKQVAAAVSGWPDFAHQAKVAASEVKRIREHHRLLAR